MRKTILSKMVTLTGLVLLGLSSYGQEEVDTSEPILDPEPRFECNFIGINQEFIVHFKNESALSIEFSEVPNEPLQVLDADNNVIEILHEKTNVIALPTYQQYSIQGTNSCNEVGIFYTFNTIPQINSDGFALPAKIYDEWMKNFTNGNDSRTIDFLRDNERLSLLEKLLIIQEYYFDGNLTFSDYNTDNNNNPSLDGLSDTVFLTLGPWWTDINDVLDAVVWGEDNKNCHCKTSWSKLGPKRVHSEVGPTHTAPYRWFEHKVDHPSKKYKGGPNRYTVYRNATKGAAKSLEGKMYMKGSHSDKFQQKFPDPAHSASAYRTIIGYNLACENKQKQSDNCMCNDRILEYTASYVTSVSTNAKKEGNCFGCGRGYAAYAQAEDWAILTVNSKKRGIKIVDAGRAYSKSEKETTANQDWNNKMIDLATSLVITLATGGTNALADSALISRVAEDLGYLINNPPNTGGGSTYGSAGNELLGGCGSEYAVKLHPNDPTNIMIHSYAGFDLGGHTKWQSNAKIESQNYLAAYIDYKQTNECCNEEVFNWIIGVNSAQQNLDALRCINAFFQIRPANINPNYPNTPFLEWTGNDEWGYYVSSNCPDHYYEDEMKVNNTDNNFQANLSNQSTDLINLYPNPSKNTVTLQWKEEPKYANVVIYNALGLEVYNQKWPEGNKLNIDVETWNKGVYFMYIETENETIKRNLLIGSEW